MGIDKISWYLQIMIWICGGLTFFVAFIWLRGKETKEMVLKSYEIICRKARSTTAGWKDYEKWERYLLSHGASFHFGTWINPVTYLLLCMGSSVSGFILGLGQSLWFALLGAGLGWLLPGFLLEYMDKKDNECMLSDLNLVYNALSIQIKAGVYVTDALAECYGCVRSKRLKAGLLRLSGDIVMKSDLDMALERFQELFNSKYIDSLCVTISQAMESGQAVELLSDIAEQIKDMEMIQQNRKKQQLDRSITFYELGIFAAIICFVIYACLQNMFSTEMFMR